MTSEWEAVSLGDFASKRTDFTAVDAKSKYEVVGVQRSGWGLVHREPVRGDSMKFRKLMRLEGGNLVYRTITAFEAPSAVVRSEDSGTFVTPQAFPVFRLDETRILPAFMSLLTTFPAFHQAMSERCTGTVLRRKTLAVGAFLEIPILLPPLDEQLRIVDLIDAVDHASDAIQEASARNKESLKAMAESLPGKLAPLDEVLFAIEAGKSPSGVEREPAPGERAVLKVSAIGPGVFNATEVKVVSPDTHLNERTAISRGDVLMVRANGVIKRVGAVCQVREDYEQLFLCDKTLRLVPDPDRLDSRWLNSALSSAQSRRQIEALTTGSHMRNITQRAIRQIKIPLPGIEEQKMTSSAWEGLIGARDALDKHADTLGALRAELLASLLSGAHRIPETYDELMGADSMETVGA